MSAIASQITNLTFVYPTVYSDTYETKHQSSASLAFVRVLHRWPVNSPHEGPVTRKMFPFDDVIMILSDRLFLLPGYAMSHKYSPVFVIVFKIVIQCILIFWEFLWSMLLRGYFIDGGSIHDDVIKWKHFPRYRPFVRGIHRSPVNSPHKGQWRGALMFTLNCAEINGWVNNREAGDLRRYRAHYDVIVMRMIVQARRGELHM